MRLHQLFVLLMCMAFEACPLWVPMVGDNAARQQQGIWEPPGTTDSSFTWIDIPRAGVTILPPIAIGQSGASAATVQSGQSEKSQEADEKARAEGESAQRDATIPRFNDVSADVEYGMLSYKNTKATNATTFSGFNISAKARYERMLDDYTGIGVRMENDFTKYTSRDDGIKPEIPGCDYLLMSAYYRKTVTSNMDLAVQANGSLFFRKSKKFEGAKLVDVILTDRVINPSVYGIYNFKLGSFIGYAGGFAGYTYCSYSYTKHQIPYAALLGGGTTFGQSVAVQGDLAVSHQFIIAGIQAPIYLTRLFSLTPGIKYPFVFEATGLQDLRVTVGASTRF